MVHFPPYGQGMQFSLKIARMTRRKEENSRNKFWWLVVVHFGRWAQDITFWASPQPCVYITLCQHLHSSLSSLLRAVLHRACELSTKGQQKITARSLIWLIQRSAKQRPIIQQRQQQQRPKMLFYVISVVRHCIQLISSNKCTFLYIIGCLPCAACPALLCCSILQTAQRLNVPKDLLCWMMRCW